MYLLPQSVIPTAKLTGRQYFSLEAVFDPEKNGNMFLEPVAFPLFKLLNSVNQLMDFIQKNCLRYSELDTQAKVWSEPNLFLFQAFLTKFHRIQTSADSKLQGGRFSPHHAHA
jgi:hypothetical protein